TIKVSYSSAEKGRASHRATTQRPPTVSRQSASLSRCPARGTRSPPTGYPRPFLKVGQRLDDRRSHRRPCHQPFILPPQILPLRAPPPVTRADPSKLATNSSIHPSSFILHPFQAERSFPQSPPEHSLRNGLRTGVDNTSTHKPCGLPAKLRSIA